MANLLKVAAMEKRRNISKKLELPSGYQQKEESNWNNNSKPAKPGKGPPAKKPSEKPSSLKPSASKPVASASKSATKPGVTASKSATKTPSKPGAAAPKPSAVASKPSKTSAASGAKSGEDTGLRGSKGESVKSKALTPTKQPSRAPSVEKLVPDKKSPSQIPSDHNLPEPQESERPKDDEKVKERKSKEATKQKSTQEQQDEKDKERRPTFCRKKVRHSIALSDCSPRATPYLLAVKKVFKEKDLQAEKSYMCRCAANCKVMLIPQEIKPVKKKSDEFAKRLTGESCGEERDIDDERPVDKSKSFNKSKSNQQITKI